jgi:hypothetical protein
MEAFICNPGACCNVAVNDIAVVYKCINKKITQCALSCSDDYTLVDCPPDDGGGDGGDSAGGASCFSNTDTVNVLNRGAVQMQHLQVGDQVLTRSIAGQNKYQPVFAFGHHSKTKAATFYQISTNIDGESPLEMTGDHLLFVGDKENPIRVDSLRVGDLLIRDGYSDYAVVSGIKKAKKTGLYAPLTPEGTIVVNGVVASSYIAIQDDDKEFLQLMSAVKGAKLTTLSHALFAHLYMTPIRTICMGISTDLCQLYDSNGIPYIISLGMKLLKLVFGNRENTFAQALFLIVTVPLLLLLLLAEKMLAAFIGLLVLFAITVAAKTKSSTYHKKTNHIAGKSSNAKLFWVLLFLLFSFVAAEETFSNKQSSVNEQLATTRLRSRRLPLRGDPSINIVRPASDFSTGSATKLEIEVEFDASSPNPTLVVFYGCRNLEVLLDGEVVGQKSFEWRGVNSGSEVFDVDLANRQAGRHSLTARAKMGWSESWVVSTDVSFMIGLGPDVPAPVRTFIQKTSIPGLLHQKSSSVEEVDGTKYQVDADITIIEKGVVNLAKDTTMVNGVQCSTDGTVRISLSAAIDSEEIARLMFPRGAVLVIDSNVYGVCTLEVDDQNPDHPLVQTDGFLAIDSVSLSSDKVEVVITGTATSFFFLFDEADISMEPVDGYDRRLFSPAGNYTGDRRLVTFGGSKEFGSSPLKLTASADFTIDASLGYKFSVGIRKGITLSVFLGFGLLASASIVLDAESGNGDVDTSAELYSYPIPGLGLPNFPIFDNLIPRAGLYFDLNYFWDYIMASNADFTTGTTLSVGTGYKKMEFWVNGGWGGLSAGYRVLRNDNGFASLDFIEPTRDSNLVADMTVYSGFSPQLSLDLFGIGRWWIRQRNGVEITAKADSDGLLPSPLCSECHDLALDMDLVIENFSIGAWIGFHFDAWWSPEISLTLERFHTLPGEVRQDLLAKCYGDFGSACGSFCCERNLLCWPGGDCLPPIDPGCAAGLIACNVAANGCCQGNQLCSLEQGGCIDPPAGYLTGQTLEVSEIDYIADWLGQGGLFVVRFVTPVTLPPYLFDERPYDCNGSPTSSRTWLIIRQRNRSTGNFDVILTDCTLNEQPDNVAFAESLLNEYDPKDGASGIVEYLDQDTGFPYRADAGNELVFVSPAIY